MSHHTEHHHHEHDHEKIKKYIAETPISATHAEATLLAAKDSPHVANVNRGVIIDNFALPYQQDQDLNNWTLLAQLQTVANKNTDPEGWFNELLSRLNKLGFSFGSFAFNKVDSSQIGVSVGETVNNVFNVLTPEEKKSLNSTINAVQQPDNSRAFTIYNHSSVSGDHSAFSTGSGTANNFLDITYKLGAFHLKYNQNVTQVFFVYSSSTNVEFYEGAATLKLSKSLADSLRATVYNTVSQYIGNNIAPINPANT